MEIRATRPYRIKHDEKKRLKTEALSHRFNGADTKSRTRDLLITNQLLYQLSYVGFGGRIIRILALYGKGE